MSASTSMVSVLADKRCIGFIINRGKAGIEAFDSNERSLGTFHDVIDAVRAVGGVAAVVHERVQP